METWKRIKNFSFYEISDEGNVRSFKHGEPRLMRPKVKRGNKYRELSMTRDDGKRVFALVHRLVAFAFLPPDPTRPTVNHKDGDKSNNRANNLEWATLTENNAHSAHKRVAMNNPKRAFKLTPAKVAEIRTAHAAGERTKSLSQRFGVSSSMIRHIAGGRMWKEVMASALSS